MALCPRIVELLRAQGMGDVLVVLGGIVPEEDVAPLHALGVGVVFGPGTPTGDIVDFIRRNVN
jgi:methylmalonyl-CoA mutase C-terminal domain/subunit